MKTQQIRSGILMLAIVILFPVLRSSAQVSINADGIPPPASAMLEVKSTTKGLLIPRMTQAQLQTITNPVNGLLVFCTDNNKFYAYIAGSNTWKEVLYGTGELTPTCGAPITDPRDNKTYNTVQIGTQCWMAQNLNIGTLISATQEQNNNSTIEKYCINNDNANCDIYGGLYQWNEMMDYTTPSYANPSGRKGICPDGWHVPSDAEWCQMKLYLDPTMNCSWHGYAGTDAGGKLKETGTIHWASPNTDATNSSGFTGLPSGARYLDGTIKDVTYFGYFWTTTESYYSNQFWYHILASTTSQTGLYPNVKAFGFSVRCVKD